MRGRRPAVPRVAGPAEAVGTLRGGSAVLGPGTGDNAAAALGLAARPGDVIVSIGTSGRRLRRHPHRRRRRHAAPSPASRTRRGHHLPLVATLNAARVLDAAAALLGVDHATLSDLALSAPSGADGLVLVPYLEGERTPNLPRATGSVHGLTLRTSTPAHWARAAVEGLLCGLADGIEAVAAQGVTVRAGPADRRRRALTGGAAAGAGHLRPSGPGPAARRVRRRRRRPAGRLGPVRRRRTAGVGPAGPADVRVRPRPPPCASATPRCAGAPTASSRPRSGPRTQRPRRQTVSWIAPAQQEAGPARWENEVIMTTSAARVPAEPTPPAGGRASSSSAPGSAASSRPRRCARPPVDVTVIGKTSHHLFQPLLYQVATGILSEGEIAPATREILRRQRERPRRARRGHRHRPRRPHRHVPHPGPHHRAPLRRADRRGRRRPVLLRQRPVRRVRARHEEHRRRPRAARPHLRRLRARRAGRGPGRDRPAAHLRRRRRRPDRAWRWPARSPSSPTARCAATSAASTPPPPASSCSTPPPTCCRRSARSSAAAPAGSSTRPASRSSSARW